MSNIQPRRTNTVMRTVRKYFVSGFVVLSFAAYALHERTTDPTGTANAMPLPQVVTTQPVATAPGLAAFAPTAAPPPSPSAPPVTAQAPAPTAPPPATDLPATPTDAPAPTAAPVLANGQYRDGTYDGPVADAYYGTVQVQAVISGGKITNVQFLDYPHDRRTSIRINNVAVPDLISEAIQAQSANVDVISGATLTSQAFQQSLQQALDTARANA